MRKGRFEKGFDPAMAELNASIDFDRELLAEDIRASQAWARALARAGLVTSEEAARLEEGLERVRREIEEGAVPLRRDLEDIHMNVEARLTELLGELGAKLHTGRSRNDQVATDFRLWVKARAQEAVEGIEETLAALLDLAEREFEVAIPAYTHLQRAQPVLLAHHLLAYAEMLLRDRARFEAARAAADVCPLGSGACAGNQFGIDREFLRKELGFRELTHNSLDAVSDRDFACDYLYAACMLLVHLSRLSEDLILWATSEFGFARMGEEVSSGSSLLPQKRNPDACELVRAKTGRVFGHLMGLLTVLKGLPLAYNKDLQEDKEGTFDTARTVRLVLAVYPVILRTLEVDRERTREALERGFLEALSVADYLTRKGVPFRKAHEAAGRAVRRAEELGVGLRELPLEEYRAIHEAIAPDVYEALALERALEEKDVPGGTAPKRVRAEIERLRGLLAAWKAERDRAG